MELLVLKLYQHASCSLISEKAFGPLIANAFMCSLEEKRSYLSQTTSLPSTIGTLMTHYWLMTKRRKLIKNVWYVELINFVQLFIEMKILHYNYMRILNHIITLRLFLNIR